jgi:HEAT repeat protein
VLDFLGQANSPPKVASQTLLGATRNPDTRLAALRVLHLSRDHPFDVSRLMGSILSDPSQPSASKLAVLQSMARLGPLSPEPPDALFHSDVAEIRVQALSCWSKKHVPYLALQAMPTPFEIALADVDATVRRAVASVLSDRPEAWAKRAIGQILQDQTAPLDLRKTLLRGYGRSGQASERQLLLNMVADRSDPLRYKVIRKLAQFKEPALDQQAWDWLRDQSEPLKVRIVAARMLIPRHGHQVLAELTPRSPP